MVDDIRVVFTKKKVKNINMRVKSSDGRIEVSAPHWVSKAVVESFVRERMDWIRRRQRSLEDSPRNEMGQMSAEERKVAKEELGGYAQELIAHWESVMGVQSQSLVFRDMSSRWGSCNPKTGRICLNLQLIKFPPECLEYVIVHELAHLRERGHGPRFKALMDHVLPDWRERRALLR